jgi:hypothetical protein
MRDEIFKALMLRILVFCDVTLCSGVQRNIPEDQSPQDTDRLKSCLLLRDSAQWSYFRCRNIVCLTKFCTWPSLLL